MKKICFVLLVCMFATIAFAQDKAADGAKKITDAQKEQFTLNDNQYKRVYEVNKSFISDLQAIKASEEGRMQKAQALKSADKNRDAQMQEILTQAQYKTYLAKKKENRQKMRDYYKENKS